MVRSAVTTCPWYRRPLARFPPRRPRLLGPPSARRRRPAPGLPPPAPPSPARTPAPPGPALSAQAEARRDYELALQVGNKSALNAFLTQYPEGFYASLAKLQLEKIAAEYNDAAATEK